MEFSHWEKREEKEREGGEREGKEHLDITRHNEDKERKKEEGS